MGRCTGAGETTKGCGLGRGRVNGRRHALRQPAGVFGVAAVLVLLSTGAAAQVYRGDGDVYRVDAGPRWDLYSSSSSIASSNDATNMVAAGPLLNVVANTRYQFGCLLRLAASLDSLGVKMDWAAGSATVPTFLATALGMETSVTTRLNNLHTATLTGQTHTGSSWAAYGSVNVNGYLIPSSSGTFGPRFMQSGTTYTNKVFAATASDPTNANVYFASFYGSVNGTRALLRSNDAGVTWHPQGFLVGTSSTDLSQISVNPITPTTLYAVMGPTAGIYRSTDSGYSWTFLSTGFSGSTYLSPNALALHPATGVPYLLGSSTGYAYKSTDGGDTWAQSATGLSTGLNSILVDPTDASIVYGSATCSACIFKSTDGGASWSASATGFSGNAGTMTINPLDRTMLLATSSTSPYMYRSTDSGASWAASGTGLPTAVITVPFFDPSSASRAFVTAGSTYKLYRSTDSGASWASVTDSIATTNIMRPAIGPTGVLVTSGGTTGGFYRSTDHGDNWTLTSKPYSDMLAGSACWATRLP